MRRKISTSELFASHMKQWEHEEYKLCNEFQSVTFAVNISSQADMLRIWSEMLRFVKNTTNFETLSETPAKQNLL